MVRISIRDLSKTFVQGPREVPAVSHVSFDIRDKEFVALVGPSGCGKSTILNMIGALVAPSGGEIVVDGERIGRRGAARSATVPRNGSLAHGGAEPRPRPGVPWRGAARAPARVKEAIALAGLEDFEEAFPATLSGGMRQRVALMRSLVVDPEILLMDEPFGALDTHTRLNLHAELLRLWGAKRQPWSSSPTTSRRPPAADRIVGMTRRPGRIEQMSDVRLARPRDVIKVRESPEYLREYGLIWHALGEEFQEVAR